jgi:hypothetical protein
MGGHAQTGRGAQSRQSHDAEKRLDPDGAIAIVAQITTSVEITSIGSNPARAQRVATSI